MKKTILLAAAAMLGALCTQAQDFGFETWSPTPAPSTSEDPNGWTSFNALTFAGMQRTVFKETTGPYAGTISAKIVTEVIPASIMIPNPFKPSEDLDTVGFLAVGNIYAGFPPTVLYGKPYAWRPAVLTFACKYTPMPGDTAYVAAFMTKWNGTSRDTVARGWYQTGATSTSYMVQNINMTYDPAFNSVMPDSQMVFCSSSIFAHDGAKRGSEFYVDAFAWSGYVSNNDIDGSLSTVNVFPNPSVGELNISSSVDAEMVAVTDVMGRIVGSFRMNDRKCLINTTSYSRGLYIFTMYDAKGKAIHKGRFEVSK
jgi:hypothetical protein